ncbi:cell surface isoform B [Micractinium conductrix]|nr:cell surface isoform B [Micractinium conductrix]|eukprot:PSC74932.1 cell surface isoform B [Micractinium conductrix]
MTYLLSWGMYGNKPSQFFFPEGITTDSQGNVCVAGRGQQAAVCHTDCLSVWKRSVQRPPACAASSAAAPLCGAPCAPADTSPAARCPTCAGGSEDEIVGIACDSRDILYVAEKKNKSVQRFTVSGTALGKWTSTNQNGPGGQLFTSPSYVAVDKDDNIYVAESGQAETSGLIKKLNRDGNLLAQWGTKGIDTSQFGNGIGGIATDANGDFFASDPYNNRIQKFKPDGTFLLKFGSQGTAISNMEYVKGLTVASDGGVYVADAQHNAVKKYGGGAVPKPPRPSPPNPPPPVPEPPPPMPRPPPPRQTRMTAIPGVATSYTYQMKWGSEEFVFSNGNFINPYDIVTDSAGFFYVLDSGNYCVQKFTPWFSFVLEWGEYGRGKSQFILPEGITVDTQDEVYIADSKQSRV